MPSRSLTLMSAWHQWHDPAAMLERLLAAVFEVT